jgi:hypothetical protein
LESSSRITALSKLARTTIIPTSQISLPVVARIHKAKHPPIIVMEKNAGIPAAVSSSNKKKTDDPLRWFLGMLVVSCFSMVYFVAPSYMITAILALAFRYPTFYIACIYASPMLLSAVVPSFPAPFLYRYLKPMLDYFDYEEIIETKPIDVADKILSGTNYLCVCQPHGALSITGIASAINASRPEFAGKLNTAVADAVLYTPIIKHVMGIFGLISASKSSMKKTLKKKGLAGTIVLYVGGMAELFLTCETKERLYLKKRKGFIKLALTEGVDIVPIYLFGNTSVLSVLKNDMLASLSRKVRLVACRLKQESGRNDSTNFAHTPFACRRKSL